MLKVKTIGLVAATALALTLAQPKTAEAGSAGKFIAGLAIGAIALGILSHNSRAYAEPQAYYQPQPYSYYPDYGNQYYAPPPRKKHYRKHAHNGPNWRYHNQYNGVHSGKGKHGYRNY